MRKVLTITGALAAAGFFIATLAVHGESRAQDGGLAVGVQGAFTDWEASILGEGASESGIGGGLVVRYTAPVGNNMFAGIHTTWSFSESAEWSESASFSDSDSSISGTITGEINWSADLLARIGTSLGGVDAYVAAGLAFASAELTVAGTETIGETSTSVAVSDSGSYTGYKIAAGIDMPIAETLETFIQAEYADYGDSDYFGAVDIEFTTIAVRAGLLYRF